MKRFLKWRRLTNRIHLVLGLIAALPVILLGLTGAVLVFEPELDRWLDPHLWIVKPGEARKPYQDLLESTRAAFPGHQMISMFLPFLPDQAGLLYARDTASKSARPLEIFVDPYTGKVLGSRPSASSLIGTLRYLHTNFLLTWGGYIGGTASAILLTLLASGLVLWWPTGKDKGAGFKVRLKRHWRTINYDAHRAVGFYATPILCVIALTGCVFTFHTVLHPLIYKLTFTKPLPRLVKARPIAGVPPMNLDRIIARSNEAMPETFPTFVVFPAKPGEPIRLTKRRPTGEPRDIGRSFVSLHPQTGDLLLEHSYRTRSFGDDVVSWNRHMHIGAWGVYFNRTFGLIIKSVWLLVSLVPAGLAVTGIVIWWKPRAKRTPKAAGDEAKGATTPRKRALALATNSGAVEPEPEPEGFADISTH
ncbi:PepSY-associated TM helix domain-containing protein [Singulisphaera sp. PoT]|uniref:PepSY-associated TM helix domain-containing protein n=1 Tax=Singulisphaera sp. PoT TaxID=3411797 RepID=UPI003BF55282